MVEPGARPAPLAPPWVLGTFHTVALVHALIWLVYPGGGLPSLLSSLGTLSGVVLFLAHWAVTLFTTRRALAELDWLSDEPRAMGAFIWRALRWGAATGMLFLIALGATQLAHAVASPTPGVSFSAVLFSVVFFGSFGTLFAAAIGGVIGVTLGA